jgi:hypothetical protein
MEIERQSLTHFRQSAVKSYEDECGLGALKRLRVERVIFANVNALLCGAKVLYFKIKGRYKILLRTLERAIAIFPAYRLRRTSPSEVLALTH